MTLKYSTNVAERKNMAISVVAQMLGLKEKLRTPLDLVSLSEKGLPKKAVSRLVKLLSINPGEICAVMRKYVK